jgi:prolyl oligopeptidase
MEDTTNVQTREWIASQAAYSGSVLSMVVGRDSIAAMLEGAYSDAPTLGTVAETPNGLILSRWLGPKPSLIAIDKGQDAEREIISAVTIGKTGTGATMRAFVPSWDGRLIAVGTTERGDANPAISIVDAVSGRVLDDRVPDLITSMEGTRYRVTWLADGTGFFYPREWPGTRNAPPAERLSRGRQFLHRLGTAQSEDIPIFGFEVVPSIAIDKIDLPTRITTGPNSRWLIASVYRSRLSGSDYYAALYAPGDTEPREWTKIGSVDDRLGTPQLRGDTVYAMSRRDADRGKIVRLVLTGQTRADAWETVLPERRGVITSFTVQNDALYATERTGGSMFLLRMTNESTAPSSVHLPIEGTINLYRGHTGMEGVLLSVESWASAPEWMRVEPGNAGIRQLGLNGPGFAAANSSLVATHAEARSSDGTLVPVSIVYGSSALRNGKLDGSAPLLVEAYGGFGASTDPSYNPGLKVWVDLGGVYAYAHARGGGELGDAWHRAATRENKQRTIDDVIAVVDHLVAGRYSSAGRVALMGMSSGAIIPGLAMLQRPELFGLALFDVGQPDEIRGAALDPTAARNLSELGDLDTPEGVRLLQNASPYHRVPKRVSLPAVIVHSSLDDYNFGTEMLAGKYVARLQKANSGMQPVIWVRTPGGHTPLLALSPEVAATAFSFILWQTRQPAYQPH